MPMMGLFESPSFSPAASSKTQNPVAAPALKSSPRTGRDRRRRLARSRVAAPPPPPPGAALLAALPPRRFAGDGLYCAVG